MRLASSVRNAERIRDITEIAAKHGFGYWSERHQLRNLLPKRLRGLPKPMGTRGYHIRKMFQELCPTFVNFGPLLSSRPHPLPVDFFVVLPQLQDYSSYFPIVLATGPF